MSTRGYTFVEMMLYMVIALIIIGLSLSLIRHTSRSYTRDRRISKMQLDGRNTIMMLAREIKNTGFKVYLRENPAGTGIYVETTIPNTTTGEDGESGSDGNSSFYFKPGNPGDTLEIFKARLDNDGEHVATERIKYLLTSGNLLLRIIRVYNEGSGNWGARDTTELAENIEAIQFQFSTDNANWMDAVVGEKQNIRGIRVFLLVRTSRQTDINVSKTYTLGDISITPASTDRYLRRLYKETVEILNNGLP